MKYKVGDKVKVRENLRTCELYGDNEVVDEMLSYRGKEVTISEAIHTFYEIEEDGGNWAWTDEMFEQEPVRLRGFEFISTEQGLKDFEEKYLDDISLKLPRRGTKLSAGYDIFAPYDITLKANEEINIPTGLKAYMQQGEVLLAFPRSGLGFKYYCRLANTIGVIDADYYNNSKNEGHMFVKIRNEGDKDMTIKKGEGICQMIFMPYLLADGDVFNNGSIRNGGFGSTTK